MPVNAVHDAMLTVPHAWQQQRRCRCCRWLCLLKQCCQHWRRLSALLGCHAAPESQPAPAQHCSRRWWCAGKLWCKDNGCLPLLHKMPHTATTTTTTTITELCQPYIHHCPQQQRGPGGRSCTGLGWCIHHHVTVQLQLQLGFGRRRYRAPHQPCHLPTCTNSPRRPAPQVSSTSKTLAPQLPSLMSLLHTTQPSTGVLSRHGHTQTSPSPPQLWPVACLPMRPTSHQPANQATGRLPFMPTRQPWLAVLCTV